ncbi:hypothetical protein L1987_54238 [Smallanthus sonchifolius]|uniref:Uncharacterized protein n=1 Tax=Smallanthus sonchifolius TaxID=185202 RepID=A0ACB9E680_9ASTR|nr:hypothetical protein L1987_54238 [Smallanthus sonchifolius]
MFNSGIRAKGLESHEEWDSKPSRPEEDGVPGERRSRDDRLRVRPEGNMAGPSNLGLDSKRRSMRLCKSGLNKQDAASEKSRRGWFGQSSEVGSMRDQRSVAGRRITIRLEKHCLDSDTCEKIMAKKSTIVKGFNCHSSKFLHNFVPKYLDELEGTGYEIERESLDHKCEYDQDKEMEIEKDENGSQTKKPIRVTSMESCVTFLDMLHIHSFVMKHKEALEIDLENLVKWFFNKVLNIQSEKPFPPKLSNDVEVKLLKLYMLVKEEGGYSKVSKESKWALIARKLGLPWELSENLKIIYMSYLDLLEWYYIKTKKDKINMKESSSSGESKFKKRRVSMVNKQVQDEMHGDDSKGNKEESENKDVAVENNK